jgi:hypothetical protein
MMDIKGDFSIVKEGIEKSFITERHANQYSVQSLKFPVEPHTLRARWCDYEPAVSEFGPVLFKNLRLK